MKTTLTLLVRDGTCFMAFTPALKAEQYTDLMHTVKQASTCEEMEEVASNWAKKHDLVVTFEE